MNLGVGALFKLVQLSKIKPGLRRLQVLKSILAVLFKIFFLSQYYYWFLDSYKDFGIIILLVNPFRNF